MKEIVNDFNIIWDMAQLQELEHDYSKSESTGEAYLKLEQGVFNALETYSNVHRGSGHFSMVSTHLFEKARDIILEYLDLHKGKYIVVFCTPRRAEMLIKHIKPGGFKVVSSRETCLAIGVRAVVVNKKALPKGRPFHSGGGTTKLVAKGWVIWADEPDRFEAGTPSVINIIAFARALQLMRKFGKDIFLIPPGEKRTAHDVLFNDQYGSLKGEGLLDELRYGLVGKGIKVPTMNGERFFINLDNSASTPAFMPVWDAFRHTWRQSEPVRQAIIEEVKTIIAETLDAPRDHYDIIFTSNTTESINLVAESEAKTKVKKIEPVVINSLQEHSSNDLPWRMLTRHPLIRIPVDSEGMMDLDFLESVLIRYNQEKKYGNKRIRIVAVSGASNVLGLCVELSKIGGIVHKYGAHLLVDAAQLVAHRKLDVNSNGIDYLAFSAHKLYAPFGSGVLIVRKGLLQFSPSEREMVDASGEENAGGIAALGKALYLLNRIGMDIIQQEEQKLTGKAIQKLSLVEGLKIYGVENLKSPHFKNKLGVFVFNLKNILPGRVGSELAVRGGIGVRYGCHCAHIIIKHVLNVGPFLEKFQGLIQWLFPKLRLPGLVRVSLGIENTEEDLDQLVHVLNVLSDPEHYSTSAHSVKKNGKALLTRSETKQQMKNFKEAAAARVFSNVE